MTIGKRFIEMKLHLGKNQSQMADLLGVTRDSWRRFESGDIPTGNTIARLVSLGFSIDWLLTGNGSMLTGQSQSQSQSQSTTSTDPKLIGRIIDGVLKVYGDLGQQLAPINQGEIVGPIYDRLAPIEDEAERRGALRYALEQLRQDLLRAASDPTSSKRQA